MCCTMRLIATAGMGNRTRRLSWPSHLENVEHPALSNPHFNNKPLNETMPALCSEVRPRQKPATAKSSFNAGVLLCISRRASLFPALHRSSRSGSKQLPPLQPSSKPPFLRSRQTRPWCATCSLPSPQGGLPRETRERTALPFTHVVNSSGDDHICVLLCLQNRNGRGDLTEKASFTLGRSYQTPES